MRKLDGLFMDFYGTLVGGEPPIEAICRRVVDQHGLAVEPATLRAAWGERFLARLEVCNSNRFQTMYDINRETLIECVKSLSGCVIDSAPFAYAITEWLRTPAPYDETRDVLAELRRKGMGVWIVSNADHDDVLATLEAHAIRVDGVVTSESARSYKPDAGIFRDALQRSGWSPGRVIHTGDSLYHDVGGAQALGLRAAWVCRNAHAGEAAAIRPDYTINDLRGLLPLLA